MVCFHRTSQSIYCSKNRKPSQTRQIHHISNDRYEFSQFMNFDNDDDVSTFRASFCFRMWSTIKANEYTRCHTFAVAVWCLVSVLPQLFSISFVFNPCYSISHHSFYFIFSGWMSARVWHDHLQCILFRSFCSTIYSNCRVLCSLLIFI